MTLKRGRRPFLVCALRKPNSSDMASEYHIGWCRYRIFPLLQKVLLDHTVPEGPEVSEECFPFSRPARSPPIKFPLANIKPPSLLPAKKKVSHVLT